ncbi:hypothetical protein DAPPUDRAFT_116786 [Daphnia pulex]|uniref:Uncharacterized protein n=1 Tax=Daphnia pulex TaxID=6669 RepID=E9HQI2_DAPPU|nr:hypothetical protein DAPPUDRAFT_116786 [Daphnia pulex]|eukprot:EFX66002.1 hypothetical protein DAPPUDRAFT_116786 [Daphnia pulex]
MCQVEVPDVGVQSCSRKRWHSGPEVRACIGLERKHDLDVVPGVIDDVGGSRVRQVEISDIGVQALRVGYSSNGRYSLSGWDGRVNWVGCFPQGQRGLAYVSKGSKQTFTPFALSTRRRVIQAEKELESTAKDLEESYVDRSIEAVKECSKKSEEDKFESIAKDLEESYVDKSIEAAQKKFLSPRVFKATPEDDAFDLLERNKSTGAYNQWGDTELRANLSMYLDGLARKWFLCSTLPTKWRDLRTPLRSSYIPQRGALGPPAPINIVSQLAETTADSSTQDEIKEQPILRMDCKLRKEVTSFAYFHCNTR